MLDGAAGAFPTNDCSIKLVCRDDKGADAQRFARDAAAKILRLRLRMTVGWVLNVRQDREATGQNIDLPQRFR